MSDPMEAHPSKGGYGVPDPYGTSDGYDAPEDSYADNADYDVSAPNDDPYAYDQRDEDGNDYPEPGYDNVDGNGDGDDVGGDPDYVDYDDVGEQGEYSEDNNLDYASYDEDGGDAGIPPEYPGHDNNDRDDEGKEEVYAEYRSYDSSQIDSSYNNGSDSKTAKPDPSQGVRNAPPQPGAGALPQSPNIPHAQRAPGRAKPSSQASHPRAVPAPQSQNAPRGGPSTGRPNTSPRASHPRAGPPQQNRNARAYENGRRLNASSRASHHAGSPHQSHNARAQPIVGRQNNPSSPLANPASAKLNPAHPLRNVPVNTTTTMHALPKTQHRPIQQLSVTAQSHAQQGFPQARPQTHNNQPHGPSNSHVYPPQPQTFGQRPPSQVQHPPSTRTAHQDHPQVYVPSKVGPGIPGSSSGHGPPRQPPQLAKTVLGSSPKQNDQDINTAIHQQDAKIMDEYVSRPSAGNPGHQSHQPTATPGMVATLKGGDRNVKRLPDIRGHGRAWSNGLCDFTDLCGDWCLACWCPCIVYGQNKARLEYLSSNGAPDPQHGGSCCSGDCCLHGSLTSLCAFGWVLQVSTRKGVRSRYSVEGSCLEDSCMALCCGPCALIQESKEMALEEGTCRGGATV